MRRFWRPHTWHCFKFWSDFNSGPHIRSLKGSNAHSLLTNQNTGRKPPASEYKETFGAGKQSPAAGKKQNKQKTAVPNSQLHSLRKVAFLKTFEPRFKTPATTRFARLRVSFEAPAVERAPTCGDGGAGGQRAPGSGLRETVQSRRARVRPSPGAAGRLSRAGPGGAWGGGRLCAAGRLTPPPSLPLSPQPALPALPPRPRPDSDVSHRGRATRLRPQARQPPSRTPPVTHPGAGRR